MSPTSTRLHFLLAAMRRYALLGRSRRRLFKAHLSPTTTATRDCPAIDMAVGTGYQLAKHGPIQITTFNGEPMGTQEGITVEITAKLAWSSALCSTPGAQPGTGCSVFDKSPGGRDEVLAQALTQQTLRTIVLGSKLSALLCEQRGIEEKARQDIARLCEASGLIVHLVRIRSINVPASVQVADDARALAAIRRCVERHRGADGVMREIVAPAAVRHLTC